MQENKRHIGLVKWFDNEKGFGTLGIPDSPDIFLHKNNCADIEGFINKKEPIVFDLSYDERKNRLTAVHCRRPETVDDFFSLMRFLGQSDIIPIEIEVKAKGRFGGPYIKKETRSFSLMFMVFNRVFEGMLPPDVSAHIIAFFDDHLDKSKFVYFADFFQKNVRRVFGEEQTSEILSAIYQQFKHNIGEEELFYVWKNRKFTLIGLDEIHDFEIERGIIENHFEELLLEDFTRIRNFSYGEEFINNSMNSRLINPVGKNFFQLIHLYQFLPLFDEPAQSELKENIETHLYEATKTEFTNDINNDPLISNDQEFTEFFKIIEKIPAQLPEEKRSVLKSYFLGLLESRTTEDYKPVLWLKGYISDLSFDQVTRYFLCDNTSEDNRRAVFNKLTNDEKEELKEKNQEKALEEFKSKANSLFSNVSKLGDLENYDSFINSIPCAWIKEPNQIKKEINKIIVENASEDAKKMLWRKNILSHIDFVDKLIYFLDENSSDEDRFFTLSGLDLNDQKDFFGQFSVLYGVEKSLILLQEFCFQKYGLPKEAMGSWKRDGEQFADFPQECLELIFTLQDELSAGLEFPVLLYFFRKGLLPPFFFKLNLGDKIENYTDDEILRILKFNSNPNVQQHNMNFLCAYFEKLEERKEFDYTNLPKLYDFALEYADSDFDFFDNIIFHRINDRQEYFKIWETKKGRIVPETEIINLILTDENFTDRFSHWVLNEVLSKEDLNNLLLRFLSECNPVANRLNFAATFRVIKWLSENNQELLELFVGVHKDYHKVIAWFLDKSEYLDFGYLREAFIYFRPEQQVRIVKKLFYLKALDKFDLTVEKLEQLARFDLELYRLNNVHNPEVPVDVSTDVVIKALRSLKDSGKFLIESELLSFVLEDLRFTVDKNIRLKDYFEPCKGRTRKNFDWNSVQGSITKVKGENQDFFLINFPYNESLVSKVRNLPGRRWDGIERNWLVPATNEYEIRNFAKENNFRLNIGGISYQDNAHLAKLVLGNIPLGIRFCEGREAKDVDSITGEKFYWCKNEACHKLCEAVHTEHQWEQYTLLDFCEILALNTDDTNSVRDVIPYSKYYQFVGLINRFNRLLEKLFCHECDHILFPAEQSNFAAHAVVRFCCENQTCSQKSQVVYLNNCLNGKCNCIIDSRESKKCPNGLYICSNCGGCCSHVMLEKRLNSLQTTGGFIHSNLRYAVEKYLGHSERAQYFCHKCAEPMDEISEDVFRCSSCNVVYDTTPYKLPRNHKNIGSVSNGRNNLDISAEDDL